MAHLLEQLGLRPPRRLAAAPGTPPVAAPTAVPAREAGAFQAERAAVALLADALRAHPQAARVRRTLDEIGRRQGQALYHADRTRWPAAMADLAAARAGCVAGRRMAEAFADYARRLATANAKVGACVGLPGVADVAKAQALVKTAAAAAGQWPPDFAGALAALADVDAALRSGLEDQLRGRKEQLAALRATSADVQVFLADDLQKVADLLARADRAVAAGDWSQVMMSCLSAGDVIGPAWRYARRRHGYEVQRLTTVGQISTVKANPETQERAAEAEALLAEADRLAGRTVMKIEQGQQSLVEASRRCTRWQALIPTIAAYRRDRALADAAAAALAQQPAAGELQAQRAAIAALLKGAADAVVQAAGQADPAAAWHNALELLNRARADLESARALAAGLGPGVAARQAAAAKPPQSAALRKALAGLKTSLAAAQKAPGADRAAEAITQGEQAAGAAEQALGKNRPAEAAVALHAAADALARAHVIEAEHGQYLSVRAGVERRLAALRALPTAPAIRPRIDAVVQALAQAEASDQSRAGAAALAALRRADDAATLAEQAGRERAGFDIAARTTVTRINAEVSDPARRRPLQAAFVDATKAANELRFADASKALQQLGLQLDEVGLKAGMQSRPPNPALAAIASRMVDKGGATTVDELIKNLPENADPKLLEALATGRYGVRFQIDGARPGAHEVRAIKRMCEAFSTVAGDIRGNPSIAGVRHVDAGKAGGAYTPADGMIRMKGRRGEQQKFGAHLTERDPKTRKQVKTLPKEIDPDCRAVDENKEIEYMGFAAAHEVGHGLDDERGFMARHGREEAKGGWQDHGADIEPVAVAVGREIARRFPASQFNRSAETRQYIRDKLANRPAVRPAAGKGSDDFNALQAFDRWHAIASAADVYRRQPDCDAIRIGTRIYHEAYPRQWVSYLAAARSKGLTGYQFRSPGEWFAELYAGWKAGKLGPRHPALEWLTTL